MCQAGLEALYVEAHTENTSVQAAATGSVLIDRSRLRVNFWDFFHRKGTQHNYNYSFQLLYCHVHPLLTFFLTSLMSIDQYLWIYFLYSFINKCHCFLFFAKQETQRYYVLLPYPQSKGSLFHVYPFQIRIKTMIYPVCVAHVKGMFCQQFKL